MNAPIVLSLAVMTTACSGPDSASADVSLSQKIHRVENGLLPAVVVRAQEPRQLTIRGVTERYRVPEILSHTVPGQTPQGRHPEVFAPGVVSTERDEGGAVISPEGDEIYFWVVENRGGGVTSTVYVTTQRDGSWSTPQVAPFSGIHTDAYIAMHPDGSRLYFQSNRPIDATESTFEWNLWYVERQASGWSQPRSLGRPINGRNHTGGPSVTRDGTLYFTIMELGGPQDLYRSRYVNGGYLEPERLPDAVNAHVQQCDSYVAPDESYLLFYAVEGSGGHGNPGGLYVAFRHPDGTWSDARKMGPTINVGDRMGSATISPDGRLLFFARDEPGSATGLDVYWVDAVLLDEMR